MQANTVQGEDIRAYFLDMEDLAQRLTVHLGVRVTAIVETDTQVTHMLRKRAGDDARAGRIARGAVCSVAIEREKLLKGVVCEVLTGHTTGYWRESFGRGVRDVLDTDDAKLYAKCYESARAAVESGLVRNPEALRKFLRASYGGGLILRTIGRRRELVEGERNSPSISHCGIRLAASVLFSA